MNKTELSNITIEENEKERVNIAAVSFSNTRGKTSMSEAIKRVIVRNALDYVEKKESSDLKAINKRNEILLEAEKTNSKSYIQYGEDNYYTGNIVYNNKLKKYYPEFTDRFTGAKLYDDPIAVQYVCGNLERKFDIRDLTVKEVSTIW